MSEQQARREGPVLPAIRERREALGMSQTAFASALGVSVRTLQNWEQGHRFPRVSGMIERAIVALETAHK